MTRTFLMVSTLLIVTFGSPAIRSDSRPATPTAQAASSQPQPQAKPSMDMMKMHEQMMAEMKAADAKLEALVKAMNAATGNAKTEAIAAVVTEIVLQQKAMHDHMGHMHQHMMGSMMKK